MAEKKNSTPTLRRWESPSYRAAYYAVERKKGVHIRGQKDSQQLTEYEKALRSGYLQCQGDHAALYKYHKAKSEGKSVKEATLISQTVNSKPVKLPPPRKKKGA